MQPMTREEAFALYAELEDAGLKPELHGGELHNGERVYWVQVRVGGEGTKLEIINEIAQLALTRHGMSTVIDAIPGMYLRFEK